MEALTIGKICARFALVTNGCKMRTNDNNYEINY